MLDTKSAAQKDLNHQCHALLSCLKPRLIVLPLLIAQAATGTAPRVAIARAGAELPMMAAKDATQAGIMTPIFVGEADAIHAEAAKLGWDISAFAVHDTLGEADAANKAASLCGSGDADVLMKGHLHTDMFMKGVLTRDNGLRTASRLVHVFHITPLQGATNPC